METYLAPKNLGDRSPLRYKYPHSHDQMETYWRGSLCVLPRPPRGGTRQAQSAELQSDATSYHRRTRHRYSTHDRGSDPRLCLTQIQRRPGKKAEVNFPPLIQAVLTPWPMRLRYGYHGSEGIVGIPTAIFGFALTGL